MKKLLVVACGMLALFGANTAFAGWWGSPQECRWAHRYGHSCWHSGPPPVVSGYVAVPAQYVYVPTPVRSGYWVRGHYNCFGRWVPGHW